MYGNWPTSYRSLNLTKHQHWDVIQANIPSICYCKDTREGDSSIHNTEHTKHNTGSKPDPAEYNTQLGLHIDNTTLPITKHPTNIYNAALNDNEIPHVWKLANIIPIPKPNKDINIGTSYRPISLLSVIAKTLEKVILPYITQNIPNTTLVQNQTQQNITHN